MVSITMRRCVAFIHDLDTTLTFDLKVKFIDFCRVFMTDLFEKPDLFAFTLLMSLCPTCNFYLLWHKHTIFGTWVYHHERMCQVYSWSWYDVDLWQVKLVGFMTWLCVQASAFLSFGIVILCLSVSSRYDVSCTYMNPYHEQYQNYISPWIWVWQVVLCIIFYSINIQHIHCYWIRGFSIQLLIFTYSMMGLVVWKYDPLWRQSVYSDTQVTVKACEPLVIS